MSKRKGLSSEEKKARMLQLFYERKEFFQLKELEKIAPKEKGIIVNSVKDVIQSLVDEGLVDTDKIGTSTYFWAYASKALHSKKRKLQELSSKFEENSKRLKMTTESLAQAETGEENLAERNKLLDEIMDNQLKKDALKMELRKYTDNDPEVFMKMKEQTKGLKEAANRWTDNIFNIKSWCKRKFNTEEQLLDKQFGIPHDFDYIE